MISIAENSQSDSSQANGELRSLHYYSWMLSEEKGISAILAGAVLLLAFVVHWSTESFLWTAIAIALMLFTIWRNLVPIHFEINSDGIARWNFGRRRLIPWENIKSYEFMPSGVILLPNREHYPLEPFHGLYIPVPEELVAELRYRLRFFVDKKV